MRTPLRGFMGFTAVSVARCDILDRDKDTDQLVGCGLQGLQGCRGLSDISWEMSGRIRTYWL